MMRRPGRDDALSAASIAIGILREKVAAVTAERNEWRSRAENARERDARIAEKEYRQGDTPNAMHGMDGYSGFCEAGKRIAKSIRAGKGTHTGLRDGILSEMSATLTRARAEHPSAAGRLAALRAELIELEEAVEIYGDGSKRAREEALDVMVVAYRLLEDWDDA